MSFQGTYTALVTPFRNGHVDVEAYRELIERQIAAGVDGIVPVGTTGESPTLNHEEHSEVIRLAVQFASGRIKVIAGTGANSTEEAVSLTKQAHELGADASLQVCPYYNKPSQEGVYRHFKAVAEASPLPIVLYSVPGRSGIEIAVETVARLAVDCPTVVCIKEAGGNVDRVNQLVQVAPEGFTVLSGDDPLTLPFMSCGAKGVISVASNIVPSMVCGLVNACLKGDYDKALEIQKKYYPLMKGLMSFDSNPIPIKCALALQGVMTDEFRLPLVALPADKMEALSVLLKKFELL